LKSVLVSVESDDEEVHYLLVRTNFLFVNQKSTSKVHGTISDELKQVVVVLGVLDTIGGLSEEVGANIGQGQRMGGFVFDGIEVELKQCHVDGLEGRSRKDWEQ
jgi:hypothetical protein